MQTRNPKGGGRRRPPFPAALRPGVICILELPEEERAAAIGGMYREGVRPNVAELLMDLEEDPAIRDLVLAELRRLRN